MARKMGSEYAREQTRHLRKKAAAATNPTVAKKLLRLAERMEKMAPEFYCQPMEGDPEMERLARELADLELKLDTCEQTGGDLDLCIPFFSGVEGVLEQHRRR